MGRKQLLEHDFETAVCLGLAENGWIYEDEARDAGWDPELALFRADALHWMSTQFPDEYAKAVDPSLTGGGRTAAEHRLLTALSTAIGQKVRVDKATGAVATGLLKVLRTGFKHTQTSGRTADFPEMVTFPPANPDLVKEAERASQNRLRVIRQVHFDTKSNETIDIVLVVNGIPVVTMELKTDNVQTIEDARRQYRQDRKPSPTRRLLDPARCLVHFAVSNEEVAMATELAGDKTRFLPFNRGNDGHAGNPPSETGSATDYLWRQVLEPSLFLRILQHYAVWEPSRSSKSGGRMVFPRYHQLRAVEAVVNDIAARGAGGTYLIWHSAGSGKTKTIAWLAHRLARHMDADAIKTFDSVIVVSDRRALDSNLREGIGLLESSKGLVSAITGKSGSKSRDLRTALHEGGHIITCTLQTFPEVISLLEGDEDLASRRWCVIADEAHSSQSGEASRALRSLLASSGYAPDEDDELTGDDLLAAKDSDLAVAANMTFVALTATPKGKTIRMFGTPVDGTDRREPFDSYSMAQAIEEGFILDVLTNYSTYTMFAQVRDAFGRDEVVDKDAAMSEMVRFVELHPTSIAQKVQVVIEHFRRNVAPLLDGKAKAMVVTEGREAAFTWCREMNRYIEEKHLAGELRTLVAFSGPLEIDGQTYTEAGLNGHPDAGAAFKSGDSYRVMIVADKYQTGYDEPRLCAMYVDKKLNGIATVQTLSRLNRIYPDKPAPMVLDFANNPLDVQADFKQFYADAHIDTDVDPNALHNLADRLDAAGIYSEDEMLAISDAYLADAGHEKIRKLAQTPIRRWIEQLRDARLSGDKEKKAELKQFRRDLRSYEHAWAFLSQIIDFQDPSLHRRAIVAGILGRNLIDATPASVEDYVSGLEVTTVVVNPTSVSKDISIVDPDGQKGLTLPGIDTERPLGERTPVTMAFEKVVEKLNDHFKRLGLGDGGAYTDALVRQVLVAASADPEVMEVIDANDPERLTQSKKLARGLNRAVFTTAAEQKARVESLVADGEMMDAFRGGLIEVLVMTRKPGGKEIIRELVWSIEAVDGDQLKLTNATKKALYDVVASTAHGPAPTSVKSLEPGECLLVPAPRMPHKDRQLELRWRYAPGGAVEVLDQVIAD
ncbi:type I restriction endonuclease subunit R [Micrococcus sp. RIT608]|uniref:type I restriction endonuclease subunit R n=1 Tax=Micrococcus sp. RIT608 TaxID=2487139 RepID=UPI000F45DFFD|nr:type I restriction endonuclease [Micrococcus sp. RIT608]RNM05431.1 type I restriction endonuclease subunit R [Micrococcus sp. RIT608]